jgi:dCMP deaminase
MARILIAYVPVLHEGYRRFLKTLAADQVYILGQDFISEIDHLRKEIRALDPRLVAQAAGSWGLSLELVTKKNLKDLLGEGNEFVLPDEDVSREFAARHLENERVEHAPVFLRWDRNSSVEERAVKEDRTISTDEFDREMITQAQSQSRKSSDWWRRVGAVLVKDGKVLLGSHNRHVPSAHSPWANGDPRNNLNQGVGIEVSTALHAEAGVIAEAAKRGVSLEGTSLYVTNFPCPWCAKLIAYSGIKKCYFHGGYGVLDGESVLRANNVELIRVEGVEEPPKGPEFIPYPEKK